MKVVPFQRPVDPCDDVERMSQKFAEDIAHGVYGKPSAVLVIVSNDEGLQQFGWGPSAGDGLTIIGLLEMAKHEQLTGEFA